MKKSSCLLCPPINIQQSTNNGDHGGWEMGGCVRGVRGFGEDGKGGEEHNNGRHNNDNNAMMINNDNGASLLPSPSPLPSQWT